MLQQVGEQLLDGHRVADFVLVDQLDNARQVLGRERKLLQGQGALVEVGLHRARHPVGGGLGVGRQAGQLVEEQGHVLLGRQHVGVVVRQAQLAGEAGVQLLGQGRQLGLQPVQPGVVDDDRGQVGLGEVAVVVHRLLAALPVGGAAGRVEAAGFAVDGCAGFQQGNLPLNLVLDGPLHVAEGIHVLDLHLGAKLRGPVPHHRHVGVAAQRALFHVAVAHTQVLHQLLDFGQVGVGFVGGAQVRLRHDFDERHAGPVQVHERFRFAGQVHTLARVLLQVDAGDADALRRAVGQPDVDVAAGADGRFVLGNLVALGQVGVEVVLAGKQVVAGNLAAGGQAHLHGVFHGHVVHLGQGAGVAQRDDAQVIIRQRAVLIFIRGIHLAVREQLRVHFQANDGLVFRAGGFVHRIADFAD